jgi:DNA-binding ferritin-like protein
MMPEQNEKVRERNEPVSTESEYPRSGQAAGEPARAEQRTRTDEERTGETQAGQTQTAQQTAQPHDESRERLVPEDHAASYGSRWDAVKGTFVDEPREAVAQADALVGELLDELETLFREQRRSIEQGLDADETSTEDLRMALRRYRSFFERLLAV